MEIVIMLAFIGLMLAGGALLLFGASLRSRDYQHADRLALLPIHEDAPRVAEEDRDALPAGAGKNV
jgi:hypothetical protein